MVVSGVLTAKSNSAKPLSSRTVSGGLRVIRGSKKTKERDSKKGESPVKVKSKFKAGGGGGWFSR